MGYRHTISLLFALTLGLPFCVTADLVPASSVPALAHNETTAKKARSLAAPEPVDLPQTSGAGLRRKIAMAGVFVTGLVMVLRLGWVRRRTAEARSLVTEKYPKDP